MNPDPFSAKVRDYWRTTHSDYINHVGTTFQAGYLASNDAHDAASHSNIKLAARAGITEGALVLDAGCGVCGPALDMARAIQSVRIVSITISPEQTISAQRLIRAAGFDRTVQPVVADYHRLPFQSALFDVACFLESAIYADNLQNLFHEVFRVLRPGGSLYIKDIFCKPGPLSKWAQDDLAEFDRTWACRTRLVAEFVEAISAAGFQDIAHRDITPEISTAHTRHAMYRSGDMRSGLTSFGEKHFLWNWDLPLFFAEIKAHRRKAGCDILP